MLILFSPPLLLFLVFNPLLFLVARPNQKHDAQYKDYNEKNQQKEFKILFHFLFRENRFPFPVTDFFLDSSRARRYAVFYYFVPAVNHVQPSK